MTASEAEKIVSLELENESDIFAVMPERTFETLKCFGVCYQTKKFIKSNVFSDIAVGHGPVLVDKLTGKTFHTGSGRTAESYVESYEKYGDPHLKENRSLLKIETNSTEISSELEMIKLVKIFTKTGISEAKKTLALMMKGKTITINNDITEEFKERLITSGFNVSYVVEN